MGEGTLVGKRGSGVRTSTLATASASPLVATRLGLINHHAPRRRCNSWYERPGHYISSPTDELAIRVEVPSAMAVLPGYQEWAPATVLPEDPGAGGTQS